MLIEFSVGNYKSFKSVQTLSLVATKVRAKDKSVDDSNVFAVGGNLKLLKCAVIYGANASGKSNLASAMRLMRNMVLNSSKDSQVEERIPLEPFRLDSTLDEKPSHFEVVLILNGQRFRYGFKLTSKRVVSEWLYYVPAVREANLFFRKGNQIALSSKFKEGRGLSNKTRPNALFLSVTAQFNGELSRKLLYWFRIFNVISGLNDLGIRDYTIRCMETDKNRSDILNFIKKLDMGIDDIKVEEIQITEESLPKGIPLNLKKAVLKNIRKAKQVTTLHRKYDQNGNTVSLEEFNIDDHESEGTKKLFAIAGPLIDTLKTGKVLFIDEFDARLHSLITRSIVELFNSKETNPRNAQLIFASHDTNLLTNKIFRRDQVWFAEKDQRGATHLYSLVEYKVRNDATFETDYIRGRYGAIPFIGSLAKVVGR